MTPEVSDSLKRLDTFPKLLLDLVENKPDRTAIREKDYGIWQSWTWSEVEVEVQALACGLASFGFERGDKIAIVGDNRPRLYWAMLATQALGGVPVPLYQDSIADEMQYVIEHAEVRFAMLENQEAGRQGSLGQGAVPKTRDADLLRTARSPSLSTAIPVRHRRSPGTRPAIPYRQSGLQFAGDRRRPRRRPFRHSLYLGHHRPAQGRHVEQCKHHSDRAQRQCGRAYSRRRGDSRLSAHGVGRRPFLFICTGIARRLHGQLSGKRVGL